MLNQAQREALRLAFELNPKAERQCHLPSCRRWFVPRKWFHIYCHRGCKQKAYRQRKKALGEIAA